MVKHDRFKARVLSVEGSKVILELVDVVAAPLAEGVKEKQAYKGYQGPYSYILVEAPIDLVGKLVRIIL